MSISTRSEKVTKIISVSPLPYNPASYSDDSFTKTTILNLKNKNENEKEELRRLNGQLKQFLNDVQRLETLNKNLLAQIENARSNSSPNVVNKVRLDEQVLQIRRQLEKDTKNYIRNQLIIEEKKKFAILLLQGLIFFKKKVNFKRKSYQKCKIN